MTKLDTVERPAKVPRKRRQIEALLDVWIAEWLASEDLSPGERKVLEGEKARRRMLRRRERPRRVALIVPEEGLDPRQQTAVLGLVAGCEVVHGGVSSRLHRALRAVAPVDRVGDGAYPGWDERAKEVIRADVDVVVACPKGFAREAHAAGGVWGAVGYAKHRKVPVRVVLPDGNFEERQ